MSGPLVVPSATLRDGELTITLRVPRNGWALLREQGMASDGLAGGLHRDLDAVLEVVFKGCDVNASGEPVPRPAEDAYEEWRRGAKSPSMWHHARAMMNQGPLADQLERMTCWRCGLPGREWAGIEALDPLPQHACGTRKLSP